MDDSLVRYIQKEIDKPKSKGGTWINLCKCVLFIGDEVFNGHHTKKAVWLSTSNTTPTMRVPEALLHGWTESEKRLLANKFNPKPQVRENDMSEDDGIKHLKDAYETDGIPAQFPSNVDMLKGLGFESSEVSKIIAKASKDIERNNLSLNSTWIDWTASGWSGELNRLKNALSKAFLNSIVTHSSTESLNLGPLEKVHDALYSTSEDNFLEETDKDIDTLIVLPHIPLPSVASKYNSDTGEREKFRSKLEMFCEPHSIDVKIITLPTDTPDSNTNGDGGFWGTRQATMWAKKNGLDGVRKKLYLEWKQNKKNKEAA